MQVNIIKGDKAAEDWEYEENAADDDDDMGEQEDVNNRDTSPSPRRYAITFDPNASHSTPAHVTWLRLIVTFQAGQAAQLATVLYDE